MAIVSAQYVQHSSYSLKDRRACSYCFSTMHAHSNILIKGIRKHVAIVSVQYLQHSTYSLKDKRACGYCLIRMHAHSKSQLRDNKARDRKIQDNSRLLLNTIIIIQPAFIIPVAWSNGP